MSNTSAAVEPAVTPAEPTYTKAQLVKAKTLGLPVDAVAAALKDGQTYTKAGAIATVKAFLRKKV
jgi:hypothetical protein